MDTYEAVLARRSIRRYTDEDVSLEVEEKLIDAAFAAPSGDNERPWHFVIVRDLATRERLSRVHEWAAMLARAPLVVGVLGRAGAEYWIEDCSAAAENMLLVATALGLGGVWVGVRGHEPGRGPAETATLEVLGVPQDWRALCLVGIGHPAQVKSARTQRESLKLSYERYGRLAR